MPMRLGFPRLNATGVPDAERKTLVQLSTSFHHLASCVSDFRSALSLYKFASSEQVRQAGGDNWKWTFIAGRDGAMTIYHFGTLFELISSALGRAPTLLSLVDRRKIRTARQQFRDRFPQFDDVRHSTAHAAEFLHNAEEHMVTGPIEFYGISIPEGAHVFMASTFVRDRFTSVIDGKFASYEMSDETASALDDVATLLASAFERADEILDQRARTINPEASQS